MFTNEPYCKVLPSRLYLLFFVCYSKLSILETLRNVTYTLDLPRCSVNVNSDPSEFRTLTSTVNGGTHAFSALPTITSSSGSHSLYALTGHSSCACSWTGSSNGRCAAAELELLRNARDTHPESARPACARHTRTESQSINHHRETTTTIEIINSDNAISSCVWASSLKVPLMPGCMNGSITWSETDTCPEAERMKQTLVW